VATRVESGLQERREDARKIGVESVWRREQRGLEMLPEQGLCDDGAPARHAGDGGGSGLQCRGRRLGATAAPRHRRSMARRCCSVLFEVHQWIGERDAVVRPSAPPPCRRRTMESVPAARSTLRSGSTRWSCAPGTATRVSSVVGSGGVVSSSAFGKRFSASSSGSTVGYSKDEAVAAGAARKAVLRSGGRRTGHEAGEGGRGMGDHRRVAWSPGLAGAALADGDGSVGLRRGAPDRGAASDSAGRSVVAFCSPTRAIDMPPTTANRDTTHVHLAADRQGPPRFLFFI
jgi:hypothetical protein